ncbi:MAG TPA: flagellar hook protein FlgE [Rhizomicrobium sp.]|nr:flagellar hook protein FlgE [Rhizomicrobium sp.]
MSLTGAMMIGVTGLNANSQALSVASSNIANVNTVGYKAGQNNFSTLLADSMGSGDISSQGVISIASQNVTQQGLLQTTESPTDLAISGNGFFVVNQAASGTGRVLYTRAGNFTPDSNGDLKNAAGFYLMGWPVDINGNIPTDRNDMSPVNVAGLSGKAQATTEMTVQANLQASTAAVSGYTAGDMASGAVTPAFTRTINVYDSQGGAQPLGISFVKTGANTWSYEVSYQGTAANITGTNPIATGTMTFNSDGTLANANSPTTPASGSMNVTIPWNPTTSGLQPQTLSLNMGTVGNSDGLTQFDSASALVNSSVNGALFGSLTGVNVDSSGFVTAQFSNGLIQKIYKLPIATFANPNGLGAVSGNAYAVTNESGNAIVGEANTGGAGSISSKSLESSTVDLAGEFTNLITTQRAYSASARIITTADQMLQRLDQIPT